MKAINFLIIINNLCLNGRALVCIWLNFIAYTMYQPMNEYSSYYSVPLNRESYSLDGYTDLPEYYIQHNDMLPSYSDIRQYSKDGTNLIVNYLPQNMTNMELYNIFNLIGPVSSCRIMKNLVTGYSYGYAFINFNNKDDASRAVKSLNGMRVRNKILKVSYARPGGNDFKETNLYITNLPVSVDETELESIFGKYGRIIQKNILKDKLTGKSRGVAFIRYYKREEARNVILSLNNVLLKECTLPLKIRIADDRSRTKNYYQMNMVTNQQNYNFYNYQ